MPILQVDLYDPADVQVAIDILTRHQANPERALQANASPIPQQPLARAMAEMKRRKIWRFLERVANLALQEYSLPELATHIGMSSSKVCSLKAILAKPERRLGIQFFELAPSSTFDDAGNPRYRMPDSIKQAIQAA